MSGLWLLDRLADQHDRETVADGLRAAIRQYYEDNTDADQIDASFWGALEKIAEYCDEDYQLLIQDVQDELTSMTGRRFVRAYSEDD